MIVALLGVLFLGGGSASQIFDVLKETKKEVKEYVVEDARQAAALETIKEMQKRSKEFEKTHKAARKEVKNIFKNNDPSAADLDKVWSKHFAETDLYNSDMVKLRFQLKENVTREEWAQIFPGG